MALILADRVRETTSVIGTGTATLLGAVTGYQSFSAIGTGNTTYYCIAGQGNSEWEVGIGTYTSAGSTLSRTTVLASSNAGSLVNFSAGTKDVFVTYPAEKALYDGGPLGTPSSGTLTNVSGLPVSTGISGLGTNVATALAVNVGSAGAFVVNGGALGTPSSGTVTNLTGTASININGTVGATTPAAGTFTSLSDSGNLAFTGTANRITGDFSNTTIANRVMFQTSTLNGNTRISLLPNGTATTTSQSFFNATDPANAGFLALAASSAATEITSGITGTGTYLPMTFYTGGSERMRVDTSGNVSIGNTPSGSYKLEVTGAFYSSGIISTGNISGTQAALQVDPAGTAVALAIALG